MYVISVLLSFFPLNLRAYIAFCVFPMLLCVYNS